MTPERKTGLALGGVAVLMVSLSFAFVPFYDWFCKVTGFGGTTLVAEMGPETVLNQEIEIRFDASKDAGMPWEFRPVQREMTVRIGETNLAFYEAYNPTDRTVAGKANYNVFPYSAGGYFIKIACFCFEEQVLRPGERITMPVSFFVDPEMVNDPEAKDLRSITLSYTFHEIPLPEPMAVIVPASTN
jgi:cytochrome c oxidase assembly protein subunit 11